MLILCSGNSARSQMAERLLRHDKGYRFEVESAGTKPGQVRPEAIAVIKESRHRYSGHRSKSVDEFAGEKFDYVLKVRDNAKETCPIFPGHANRLHQNFEDPAAAEGSEAARRCTFRQVRDQIRAYLRGFPPAQHPASLFDHDGGQGCARHAASRDLRSRAGAYRELAVSQDTDTAAIKGACVRRKAV